MPFFSVSLFKDAAAMMAKSLKNKVRLTLVAMLNLKQFWAAVADDTFRLGKLGNKQ